VFFCNDWNAEYDSSTEVCECKSGYTASKWGCIRTWTDINDAMTEWRSEVASRLAAIDGAGTWPKLSTNRYNRIVKRMAKLGAGVNKKYRKGCGKSSVAANTNSVQGTSDILIRHDLVPDTKVRSS